MRQEHRPAGATGPALRRSAPTPIPISRRTRSAVAALGVLAFALLLWFAPGVPVTLLGGFAVALVLSFPVRWFSRLMPRGLAILATFLVLVGAGAFALLFIAPVLIGQLVSFVDAVPTIAREAKTAFLGMLQPLADRGLLQGTPDEFMSRLGEDLANLAKGVAQQVLGGLVSFVSGAFALAFGLFGVLFVAVYLLVNVRRMKATYLKAAPKRYRRDAHDLWDAFAYSLSRYLSGLGLDMLIQGVISTLGLYLIGIPYALLLGVWVSIIAIIPYLGPWLGAIPAVIVAFTVSPTTALLTALFYLVVQQIEGNLIQPRIQGSALNLPSILIFLGVIAGGQLAGLLGVIFAVPALAVLKVLFDFFRARVHTVN